MTIKNKYSIPLIIIALLGISIIIINNFDKPGEESVPLHKVIASEDVEKVRMGVMVYHEPRIEAVDIDLTDQEINEIRSFYNSVPADRMKEVQEVNPALVAGIVFNLKSNAEVRIQYDKKDVYVTRTDKTGQEKYIVEFPELKSFFENKLESISG
ncbi:hypothetical protein AB6A23_04280 [Paenibacillus tarimensis]